MNMDKIQVWGKLIKRNKIIADYTVFREDELKYSVFFDCLQVICDELDIEMPIILDKHIRDIGKFLSVRFLPNDFIEEVKFDRFEVNIFIEKENN